MTNQTNIIFVNKMSAVMAAQAMQLLAIHYGYHTGFEYWTYDTGSSDHIRVSMITEDKDIELPNGYLYSEHSQFYLEDSQLWVHAFDFKY